MLLPHYLPSHKADPPEFPIQRIHSWSVYSAIQLPAAISIWGSSGFLVLWSENVQLPEGGNLGKLYPPGVLSKYFRPHLVNRVDFAPSMTSARITPAPAVACLQADTGVIRLQPYLRQTSLNFPKWEMLSFIQQLTVTEVKLVFPHIARSLEAIWEDDGK